MESLLDLMPISHFVLALLIAMLAGLVKGVVGFAMPMIFISGLSSFLAPELALAGLLLPTLIANGMQAFRQGVGEAWASLKAFRLFLIVGAIVLIASAQLLVVIPSWLLYLIIGVGISTYCIAQLAGWQLQLDRRTRVSDTVMGIVGGFFGGLSAIWGPQTVMYLTAINTPKQEQIRIQGVVFGLGALLLVTSHMQSGVLDRQTATFSAVMLVPAILGLWLGFRIQDRIDQATFRTVTIWVLLVAGLNLIRRALIG